MKDFLGKVWRWVRWPLGVVLVLYIALVIYETPAVLNKKKSDAAVAQIHAQKITLDDVMGKNLPLAPDPKLADATVAGIDANHNGIRDDVELAIFKLYPNSAKIRTAELQYAMALQMEFTQVFDSGTLVAVIQQESRGSLCMSDLKKKEEIKALVFNTDSRKQFREKIYQNYMTSYEINSQNECDILF